MPEPMKSRYKIVEGGKTYHRIPCDDVKVADTLVCTDLTAYCTKPDDKVMFSIQGSGEVYFMEETCADFFDGYQDWKKL